MTITDKPKILIVDDEKDLLEVLEFAVSELCDAEFTFSEDGSDAIRILNKEKFDLIICDFNMPRKSGGDVYEFLLEKGIDTPYVLCSSEPASYYPSFENDELLFGEIVKPNIFESLEVIFDKLNTEKWDNPNDIGQSPVYIPITVGLCVLAKTLPVDVFLTLPDNKVLKVHKEGDSFSTQDAEKYKKKNIRELFVQKSSLDTFKTCLIDRLGESRKSDDSPAKIGVDLNEVISLMIKNYAINEEVVRATKVALEDVFKESQKQKELHSILKDLLSEASSYNSSHSILQSFIACSMLEQLPQWRSRESKKKLVYACFLHDIDLPELDSSDVNYFQMYQDSLKDGHPVNTVDKLHKLPFLDDDTIRIVREHHERPDGSGSPRGLTYKNLLPLSIVFIISHDLASITCQKMLIGDQINSDCIEKEIPISQYNDPLSQKCYNAYKMIKLFKD